VESTGTGCLLPGPLASLLRPPRPRRRLRPHAAKLSAAALLLAARSSPAASPLLGLFLLSS
jgi:hypothetical protein